MWFRNVTTEQQTYTTVQEVKVSGDININVTPNSMKQELHNALNSAEFKKAITTVVVNQKEEVMCKFDHANVIQNFAQHHEKKSEKTKLRLIKGGKS